MDNKTYAPPRPHGAILEVLKGSVSEPVETVSNKPDSKGQVIKVSIVKKGSGMVGLQDAVDNQEWAGIFNHILMTARVATFLGEKLREKGEAVDPDCILNTILVSHAGRRQYDEATWYPSIVPNASWKVEVGDTAITRDLLSDAHISPIIVENVKAHGVGDTYPINQMNTWEKILPSYADFRVSQHIMPLEDRFDDLERRGVTTGRFTKNHLDVLKEWAFRIENKIFSKLQINPEHITDTNPSVPRWERYLRRLYINDAEEAIFMSISRSYQESVRDEPNVAKFDKGFSKAWWERYVSNLYEFQQGTPYVLVEEKRRKKLYGIGRAIAFFKKLDEKASTLYLT
ncbi:MAG TPA: hypothetical protein VEP90_00980 [Methylomirabilota bacterium]|nr:hypothetical protein [Methylomirabilota bacterium]